MRQEWIRCLSIWVSSTSSQQNEAEIQPDTLYRRLLSITDPRAARVEEELFSPVTVVQIHYHSIQRLMTFQLKKLEAGDTGEYLGWVWYEATGIRSPTCKARQAGITLLGASSWYLPLFCWIRILQLRTACCLNKGGKFLVFIEGASTFSSHCTLMCLYFVYLQDTKQRS
jgi:hypothetical protein